MSLFPGTGPNLFSLLPGSDFARCFAEGFFARLGHLPPQDLARTTILVNTGRALRSIEEALADFRPSPGLLPRTILIPELHSDPLLFGDIPSSVSPLRRRLHLTRLIEAFLENSRQAGEAVAAQSAAIDLADELALLMDQFHDEGISADRLQDVLAGSGLDVDAARHWERTLEFVDLVRSVWPDIRREEEGDSLDPRERQRAVIDRMIADWSQNPPDHPVIAAASTGSVAATAALLAAIARLPNGAVVLPGFDPDVEPEIWDSAGPDHPLGPFKGVFDQLDAKPDRATPWVAQDPGPRVALLAQALRPAPVTDRWHAVAGSLASEAVQATEGMALIEAEHQRGEAEAIAVAIRRTLEQPGKSVALITPDAALARRVAAALGHFDIEPDDTVGQPLGQSPPAVLLRLIIELAEGTGNVVQIAALLQHPLVCAGLDRLLHLDFARTYEQRVLRGSAGQSDGHMFPSWPKAEAAQADWLAGIETAIAPLAAGLSNRPLRELIGALRSAAEHLTDPGDGSVPSVWAEEAGQALDGFLSGVLKDASAFGDDPVVDFGSLLTGLMRGEQLRPKPRRPHPRVRFSGPREARLEHADLVILGGLNDGVWPEIPDAGPWLSRPMRQQLGLPLPERSVGLSAHDFFNAACRPEVILTRAKKMQGAATVASRWLIRLETLMKGIGAVAELEAMKDRGTELLDHAGHLGRPAQAVARAERPAPRPPADARPRRLSVTGIETLIRDAYAVYAQHVLGLRVLEPLYRTPDARDRGTILHKVLELFVERTGAWPGREAAAVMLAETADEVLGQEIAQPDLRRIWRARIDRFGAWFLDQEDQRRAGGDPVRLEAAGSLKLDLPGGPFEITAKADRIDRLHDGQAAIYDYKSGDPPTNKQIERGFNHQLHVQAAILKAGGFDEIQAMQAEIGAYLGLTGSGSGGKETVVEGLSDQVAQHMDNLRALLERFERDAPYVSHSRPEKTDFEGDYDHLARLGEWTLGDGP